VPAAPDPIRLEIFKHLFASIADEMGLVLRKASYSPNIKERRDFSCAIFNSKGEMIAQAAHIPVHLGSMPLSVEAAVSKFSSTSGGLQPGDAILLNDPFLGGTHLPDITLVTPVFLPGLTSQPLGFVASRAHHADVGGMMPGSMPVAQEIYQEGIIIPPIKLFARGEINQDVFDLLLANVRTPEERQGDLWAQIACNQRGSQRFIELVTTYGEKEVSGYMEALLNYTERMARNLLRELPNGTFRFADALDDDGIQSIEVPIQVSVTINDDRAIVDFTGSAPQQQGSINAVYAITLSAVYYVFRCLMGLDVPNNAGCLRPIEVIAPPGTVVNARRPAAVAGGNVETSQRIVDVLLGALAQALPAHIPAASQGTMNNLSIGGWDLERNKPFSYYETMAGGQGAAPGLNGANAIHTHMTNTLNTPVEALEYAYPLQVQRYALRQGSGGSGQWQGGEGILREIKCLVPVKVTLLTDRRRTRPYGLTGGEPGAPGENTLLRENTEIQLQGKGSHELHAGDVLCLRTPGGGGWGSKKQSG
jgi:N-methylhydantoinase B